ncbi:tyrosine-protein phosphatase [Deinococcus malanensis]|nr:tyrosine-protein phosphatase [Deinococcus malanensis]
MSLDYTAGCVNFRDVGEWLNLITGQPLLHHGRLLRGGKLDHVTDATSIREPATVMNLRRGPDRPTWLFGAQQIHLPADDGVENYDTQHPKVRRWLGKVVHTAAAPETELPLLLHCTSGKDRTGVAIAAILFALGVAPALITEEYLLSDGAVRREWIEQAIAGFAKMDGYFDGVNIPTLQQRFCLGTVQN